MYSRHTARTLMHISPLFFSHFTILDHGPVAGAGGVPQPVHHRQVPRVLVAHAGQRRERVRRRRCGRPGVRVYELGPGLRKGQP